MIGQTLNNRYTITSLLGEGAMGEVYLAIDQQADQQVAVKILARHLITHPELLERFRREGETLRQLNHPNIVKFVDAFEHEGQFVIIMEYVSGGSLHGLIKDGPLPIERARQITLDLCDALIRAHRLNIIHRDLKPENILIDADGTPKLADFGVARLSEGTRMTRSGTQVGTPYYMSPEAWEGKSLDAQADIWSLGVVFFEMLTGQVPFGGDTGAAVMNKVLTTHPPDLKKTRAEVPAGLAKIVNRMLTRDQKYRYQTMREVAVDLERGRPLSAAPAMLPTGRMLAAGAFLIVIIILGAWLGRTNFLRGNALPTNTQPSLANPTQTVFATSTFPPVISPTSDTNETAWSEIISVRQPTLNETRDMLSIWVANSLVVEDILSPGVQTFSGSVDANEQYLWPIYWCSIDQATLERNMQNISTTLTVNGEKVPDEFIFEYYVDANDAWKCNYRATVISNFTKNTSLNLQATRVLATEISDGQTTYPAGTYTYELVVLAR
jgi:serine/threonine protein kinase